MVLRGIYKNPGIVDNPVDGWLVRNKHTLKHILEIWSGPSSVIHEK